MPRRKVFQNAEETSDINVSALLDMVFILLIFFVVTSTFSRETGVDINKPKASSATQIKDQVVKMGVTADGSIHIHEKQVGLEELRAILEREKSRNPEVKAVIVADERSTTGAILKVLDQCNEAGIVKTSIAADGDK